MVIADHACGGEPEKGRIAVDGADHLDRELCGANRLADDKGNVKLKEGANVDLKIAADPMVSDAVGNPEDSGPLPRRYLPG